PKQSQRPAVETLESRETPAVDTFIWFRAGQLTISGTAGPDSLQFELENELVAVTARNGTTFNNGQTAARFSGVTGISASLGRGDDVLTASGHGDDSNIFSTPGHGGDITLDGGGGNNTIVVENVALAVPLKIVTADGNDSIVSHDFHTFGQVTLDSGGGADR